MSLSGQQIALIDTDELGEGRNQVWRQWAAVLELLIGPQWEAEGSGGLALGQAGMAAQLTHTLHKRLIEGRLRWEFLA